MMNDRFIDLAMKVIAGQATAGERTELDSALADNPKLQDEFGQLRASVGVAKEVIPLLAAIESNEGEFPAYARERLQTKVKQTLGRPAMDEKQPNWSWRLWFVLVPATALIVLLLIPVFKPPGTPVLQLAMFDAIGATRAAGTNEVALLQQAWKDADVQNFAKSSDLEAWETNWQPEIRRPQAKILFDRTTGEVRVSIRWKGETLQKTIPVNNNLPTALQEAKAFISENTRR